MTNFCPLRPTPWSVATAATAKCKRRFTAFVRSKTPKDEWQWISSATNKQPEGDPQRHAFTKPETKRNLLLRCYSLKNLPISCLHWRAARLNISETQSLSPLLQR